MELNDFLLTSVGLNFDQNKIDCDFILRPKSNTIHNRFVQTELEMKLAVCDGH